VAARSRSRSAPAACPRPPAPAVSEEALVVPRVQRRATLAGCDRLRAPTGGPGVRRRLPAPGRESERAGHRSTAAAAAMARTTAHVEASTSMVPSDVLLRADGRMGRCIPRSVACARWCWSLTGRCHPIRLSSASSWIGSRLFSGRFRSGRVPDTARGGEC
jgi:hypothetical protein